MRIERISIEAYRSLYDVTLKPEKFTVLVGPNNSGKSNVVEFDLSEPVVRTATRSRYAWLMPLDDPDFHDYLKRALAPNDLLLSNLEFTDVVAVYKRGLASAKLYQLAPLECRRPGVSTP